LGKKIYGYWTFNIMAFLEVGMYRTTSSIWSPFRKKNYQMK
jgi:hypothetical protein